MSLRSWPGRRVSNQSLFKSSDYFFEKERPQVRVQGHSHWATSGCMAWGPSSLQGLAWAKDPYSWKEGAPPSRPA